MLSGVAGRMAGDAAAAPRATVRRRGRRVAAGVSIVEMMVGITIGLFILAAASAVATSQLVGNRDAMVRVQMQQDLRVITDVMVASMERSGFYMAADRRVWRAGAPASYGAPYDRIAVDGANGPGSGQAVEFSASADELVSGIVRLENDVLDAHDRSGFRLNAVAGTIEVMLGGGGWQTLSDPQLMRVTDLRIDVTERVVPTPCGYDCEAASPGCFWTTKTREYRFRIDAQAVANPAIQRSVEQTVRSRSPVVALTPGC